MSIKLLRAFIKEEVERNLRWSAGFVGGGLSGAHADPRRNQGLNPLPGLGEHPSEEGDTIDGESTDDEEEFNRRFTQPGARQER